jgi:hypothetical protein
MSSRAVKSDDVELVDEAIAVSLPRPNAIIGNWTGDAVWFGSDFPTMDSSRGRFNPSQLRQFIPA